MYKRIFLSFIIFLLATSVVSAREIINLNKGWTVGKSLLKTEYRKPIDLPHSWDRVSAEKEFGLVNGSMSYLREINIPSQWEQNNVFIRFNGVAGEATLFVNGKYIGKHNGSFTAFTFDISHNITYGAKNSILLYVNNSPQMGIMPLGGKKVNFGGIYRDVELIVTNKEHISTTHYSSNGVYITTKEVNDDEAVVNVDVMLKGNFGDKLKAKVVVQNEQGVVSTSDGETTIMPDGSGIVSVPVVIVEPRLWNGRQDPFMYTAQITLYDAKGAVTDVVTEEFGVRTLSVDRQKGFMLNGNSYPLYGVLLNQERNDKGYALSKDDMKNDLSLVNELGATAVRFAYAPHDKSKYTLCDKTGIIVWSDLPFYGDELMGGVSFINSFDFKNSGITQLKEMVWQNYNHPSIAFWGLFSNLAGSGDNPLDYLHELNDVAKLISPDRITVGVSNQDGSINNIPDVISFSQYLGWRKGVATDFNIWLNAFAKGWLGMKPAVGEYGFGGNTNTFAEPLNGNKVAGASFPESTQLQYHKAYLDMLQGRSYIWGYFVNSLFDDTYSFEKEMGLVTSDRFTKKDVFYLYKAVWNKSDKFIYLAGKRDVYRNSQKQNIIAITNLSSAELIVNGTVVSTAKNNGGMITWSSVKLRDGDNHIVVQSDTYRDEATITVSRDI